MWGCVGAATYFYVRTSVRRRRSGGLPWDIPPSECIFSVVEHVWTVCIVCVVHFVCSSC